ncbi:respiratory nitrate reductase subunit gamma [Luteithermobacter gelatinilyticus]|uniref:respiratory nitrate reductase subunit gamma n=1 Tax=Luteithermobacter gelatinilyticus TaxID=2582913 RepID=UPI001106A6FB|nr:respiratory nitrate reductase subunit gamma [Luteithermobacter gelatinilyticus]|tara:strand:+ start:12091 stop:12774 length:684 start_codon:yes stop_codon:yes gene_type:complete
MSAYLNEFFFGIYPYLAIVVMILGTILRYDQDPYSWRAGSSQLLRSRGMRIGSNLFHIGIILLFFGHLIGLLTPEPVYHLVMSAAAKQMLAMVAGGIFGVICFIGLTILIIRRLTDPRIRATSRPADIMILLVLYVQLILGLATIPASASHPDGSSMIALANWAQYIVTFRGGAADFVAGTSLIFKLHIVLGLTIFLLFPFTRLVHVLSAPVKYLFRSGYQIVRKRS